MSTAIAKNPGTRMARLIANPGWISAWRARPIGSSGDASTATTHASAPPATPITATRDNTIPRSWLLVVPRFRKVA